MRRFPEALKNYEQAAATLAKDVANYDDARCDLAMVETMIGGALVKMGRLKEANDEYVKALDTSNLPFSIEHNDIPSLYAAAEAYAGLGDVAMAQASKATDDGSRSRQREDACLAYQKSSDLWKRIPSPTLYSPNGYMARGPGELAEPLSECKSKARPF